MMEIYNFLQSNVEFLNTEKVYFLESVHLFRAGPSR